MSNPYPKTEAELLALIRKHGGEHGHELTTRTARRFCAYVEVQSNLDSNSTRDWVDLFERGFPGFKTTKHVDDWLDSYQDADDEDFDRFINLIKLFLG